MSSLVRINANRINASKSTGPVTPEGKAKVSQNAVKHGLLAKSIVLPSECAEGFETVLAALRAELQPTTRLENEYIEIMAAANWRRKRVWAMEADRQTKAIQSLTGTNGAESPSMQTALAFADLCDHSTVLRVLHRYETKLSREFLCHLRLFYEHKISKQSQNQTNTDV